MRPSHREIHLIERIGWLRAAVLGANDGLISTASLIAGIAGLVAGAMSMAAGEYLSVSSQADTEAADTAREQRERGIEPDLARKVAEQMMAKDGFAAHAGDELGLASHVIARPVQAALTSADIRRRRRIPLAGRPADAGPRPHLDRIGRVPARACCPRRHRCPRRRLCHS